MLDDFELSRFLMLAVDAWRYGPRDDRQQVELQHCLDEGLRAAARRSGLDDATWRLQDAGDGRLALLSDSGSEPVLVDAFVRELDTWLARHNHDRVPDARLRLRVAVHNGLAIPAPLGYGGNAVVHVCRLRDARPVRAFLDAAPDANLVLAISERVFDDVIRQRHTSLSPRDFTKVEIADARKDFAATAWIRVPGFPQVGGERIAIGLRFLVLPHDTQGFVEQVLVPAFASAGIAPPACPTLDGDSLVIHLLGVSAQVVLGLWVDRLDRRIQECAPEVRVVVGVCSMVDRARELASSDTASRVLTGVRGGRVAIVVPDHLYEIISDTPARLVCPEAYARAGASSWLRVLGHAMPPPVDCQAAPARTAKPPTSSSVSAYGTNGVAIGSGTFDTFVVGSLHRHDGASR